MLLFTKIRLICRTNPFQILTSVRNISNSFPLRTKAWRASKGLPVNRTAEGILTDEADYTFLDGRPTPIMSHQKRRMIRQRDFAKKIVDYNFELGFALQRELQLEKEESQEKETILKNRLKPKGIVRLIK